MFELQKFLVLLLLLLTVLQIRAKKTEKAKSEARNNDTERVKRSKSRRVDDSSTEDTFTDSSDSEDGKFYANKKNFYKANQYEFLEDKSNKVCEFKEGGQSIKFDTFFGYKDALKALSFIQQFDIAFAGGRYSEHSKIRRAALGLPTEIRDHCLEQKSTSIQELMSHAKRGFAIHSGSLTYPTDEVMT
ncbi:hypothetical protein L7F22_008212 [Adiantum nelumboides]|nr:hypothetical protein [Adiantum nelumboides]